MVKIYRTTNDDARALVSDGGRAYKLTTRRRALIREQLGDALPEDKAGPAPTPGRYDFSGREPIIDCIRAAGDGRFHVTTGDFQELGLDAEQLHALLDDE